MFKDRYFRHKLAQVFILLSVMLAPCLLALYYLTFKSNLAKSLLIRNTRLLIWIINHELSFLKGE